jgi:hypothetical protein
VRLTIKQVILPEIRSLIQAALDVGWTLVCYEANHFQWLSARYHVDFPDTEDLQEMLNQLQHVVEQRVF